MSKFQDRLLEMGYRTYKEYLYSDTWSSFKKKYMESDLVKNCRVCGSPKIQLHHHTYARLGKEELTDVTPLCRWHHELLHKYLTYKGIILVERTEEVIRRMKRFKGPGCENPYKKKKKKGI